VLRIYPFAPNFCAEIPQTEINAAACAPHKQFCLPSRRPEVQAADDSHKYIQMKKVIIDGKDIHMTLDLAACFVHETAKPGPSIRGSIHFEDYMVGPDRTIAVAETRFTYCETRQHARR
jgi:hypothetical protein